jgi:tRNA modification GTPase
MLMNTSGIETIAAIATAPGEGAVSIVRVSGPGSLAIADRLFKGKAPLPSFRPGGSFVHGLLEGPAGVTDEVILLIYRAPHSYTREDAVEIQGHGGSAAAKRILRAVLDAGARLAEPGEFTKRAFLSGRIDLVQAEAVLDLIRARTDRAAQAALEQLNGRLSGAFNALYDKTLVACGDLESTLDFSEDELPATLMADVALKLKSIRAEFKRLLDSWDEGHVLREGASVAIAGRPNVGKSTLLNALLGKERAIVTPLAGTTRDTIEEQITIDGYLVRICDTAGLRDSSCLIEQDGIRRARELVLQSDLIIYVVDGSLPFSQEDRDHLARLQKHKTIIVINKSDISINETVKPLASDWSVRYISAARSEGLEDLKKGIIEHLGVREGIPHHAVISERHRHLLISAHKDIVEAGLILSRAEADPTLAASRLRMALETLGTVTGRIYHEELLNNIFSRFCIGK